MVVMGNFVYIQLVDLLLILEKPWVAKKKKKRGDKEFIYIYI